MAKRFTCTDKWRKRFLRGLDAPCKLLWLYLLDDCNHAGIWEVEIDVACSRLGISVSEEEAISAFGDKVQVIDDGDKWFIPSFIDFQYGELRPTNKAHNSVINILKRKDLIKPLGSPLQGVQDKDKDKELEKDKEKPKRRSKKQIIDDLPETMKPFWERMQPLSVRNNPSQCAKMWISLESQFSPEDIFGYYVNYSSKQSGPEFVSAFSVQEKVNPLNIKDWISQGRPGSISSQSQAVALNSTSISSEEIKRELLEKRRANANG